MGEAVHPGRFLVREAPLSLAVCLRADARQHRRSPCGSGKRATRGRWRGSCGSSGEARQLRRACDRSGPACGSALVAWRWRRHRRRIAHPIHTPPTTRIGQLRRLLAGTRARALCSLAPLACRHWRATGPAARRCRAATWSPQGQEGMPAWGGQGGAQRPADSVPVAYAKYPQAARSGGGAWVGGWVSVRSVRLVH